MTNFANKNILSIYDLNQMVKDLLMDSIGHIRLIGEVSNFSKPASGHWYFTLKDDKAQVRCAMFRNANFKTGFIPKDGQQVIVSASVTLYEARGDYQLIINQLELAGIGLLQQKFEQLKEKLKAEGLFESIYKKTIPKNCQTVGIITSSTGAALHDICQILKRRDPSLNVIIYPTQVQGEGSAENIARMIKIANIRQECDVLIVGRGGGSLEDLWSFNEEVVARAIFESKLPIISAVGHEVDITIADFVADLRAATPSAAAELISRDRKDQVNDLKVLEQHLAMAMDNLLLRKSDQLQRLRHRLQSNHPQVKLTKQQALLTELIQHLQLVMTKRMERIKMQLTQCEHRLQRSTPQNLIQTYQQRIQKNEQMLITQFKQKMDNFKHIMAMYCTKLNAVSPLATIERGYSITTDEKNHIVRSFKQVKQGDKLVTKLPEGIITSTVTGIKKIRR